MMMMMMPVDALKQQRYDSVAHRCGEKFFSLSNMLN